MNAENVVKHLDMIRAVGEHRWIARCPAHHDRSPSLSITGADDGRVLIHCFAGCGVADILAAVGLTLSDLFPPNPKGEGASAHRTPRMRCGLTVREAVALLSRDALTVAVAASNIAAGTALTPDDLKLLATIAVRMRRTWEVRYGNS